MQLRLIPLLCTVSFLGAGSPALAQHAPDRLWFHGRWAEDQTWCRVRLEDRTDERPIVITPHGLDLYEISCRVERAQPTGGRTYRLHARCREHGEPDESRRVFQVSPAGAGLRLQLEGGVWVFGRCS